MTARKPIVPHLVLRDRERLEKAVDSALQTTFLPRLSFLGRSLTVAVGTHSKAPWPRGRLDIIPVE